jgi:GNAT superfamily N-acetyltransferase
MGSEGPIVLRVGTPADMAEVIGIDDDATRLFETVGLAVAFPPGHPFIAAEEARWRAAAQRGGLFLALDAAAGDGRALGFAALGRADGAPYLEQLSVRVEAMRRGIGRRLLRHALAVGAADGAPALWLTTYDHFPWNRPFYEREGFAVVPEGACGPEVRGRLDEERLNLPAPAHRVAMRRFYRG